MVTVQPGEEFIIPIIHCPECDGRVLGEVSEWGTDDRTPTPGGMLVYCEHARWHEPENLRHRYCQSDWIPVQMACDEWAAENVRIVELMIA